MKLCCIGVHIRATLSASAWLQNAGQPSLRAAHLLTTDDDRDGKGRSLAHALMFGGGAGPVVGVRPDLDVLVGGAVLDQATAGLSSRANKDPDGAKLALAQLLVPLAAS